jgi:hypothetical protein
MKLTLKNILESSDISGRGYVQTKRKNIITITGFKDKITPERVQKYLKPQGADTDIDGNTLIVKDVLVSKRSVTSDEQKIEKLKNIFTNAGWSDLKINKETVSTGDVLEPKFESTTGNQEKSNEPTDDQIVKHLKNQITDFAKKNKLKIKSVSANINGKPVQLSFDLNECGCETGNTQYQKPRYRPDYPDPEGEMAKQQLYKVAKYAAELYKMLDDNDELDSWVQDKLSKISDNISSVKHYIEYEKMTNSSDY